MFWGMKQYFSLLVVIYVLLINLSLEHILSILIG